MGIKNNNVAHKIYILVCALTVEIEDNNILFISILSVIIFINYYIIYCCYTPRSTTAVRTYFTE